MHSFFFPAHSPERGNTLFYIMITKWLYNNIDFGSCKFLSSRIHIAMQCDYSARCVFVTLQIISKPSSLYVYKKQRIRFTWLPQWCSYESMRFEWRNSQKYECFVGTIQFPGDSVAKFRHIQAKKNIFFELMWSDNEKNLLNKKTTNGHVFQMLVHVFLWLNGQLKLKRLPAMLWNI